MNHNHVSLVKRHMYQTIKSVKLSAFKNRKPERIVKVRRSKEAVDNKNAIAESLKLLASLEVIDF